MGKVCQGLCKASHSVPPYGRCSMPMVAFFTNTIIVVCIINAAIRWSTVLERWGGRGPAGAPGTVPHTGLAFGCGMTCAKKTLELANFLIHQMIFSIHLNLPGKYVRSLFSGPPWICTVPLWELKNVSWRHCYKYMDFVRVRCSPFSSVQSLSRVRLCD